MIYFARHIETGLIKIGHTRQFMRRIIDLIGMYGEIELLGLMDGGHDDEQRVHRLFHHLNCKARDRWFSSFWGSEWFVCEQGLLDYIKANTNLNFPLPFAGDVSKQSRLIRVDIDQLNIRARNKKKPTPDLRPMADELERVFRLNKVRKREWKRRGESA